MLSSYRYDLMYTAGRIGHADCLSQVPLLVGSKKSDQQLRFSCQKGSILRHPISICRGAATTRDIHLQSVRKVEALNRVTVERKAQSFRAWLQDLSLHKRCILLEGEVLPQGLQRTVFQSYTKVMKITCHHA